VNEYGTHLPVLEAIGRSLPIRWVLEFGGGQFSTLRFLDRTKYPILSGLVSVENIPLWRRMIRDETDDKRLQVIERYEGDCDGFDLVLIDDGQNAQDRIKTIENVISLSPDCPVVIHEWNNVAYQEAVSDSFENVRVYNDAFPYTALLWNGDRPELEELCRIVGI
jgi:hypothetical protein